MVLIPAGEFIMGMEGSANKAPHKVNLDAFYMDTHEVTQSQYEKMRGSNPSKFKGPDLPVEQVTWSEANAYCMQMGKRLPTEAEWEKAARVGSTANYAWGNSMDPAYAWFKENANDTTHPVGQKKPNTFGLFDMNGNVWEWVADWYDKLYYENSPAKNPKGPDHGEERVIRGGSWYSGDRHLLSATRYWSGPSVRNSNFGFRCAHDAS
jgi:formylglycine-generating enzyme required for sulfatase activity